MLKTISEIGDKYVYFPIIWEIQGISLIGVGAASLGLALLSKIEECAKGRKRYHYDIGHEVRFFGQMGKYSLQAGFKKLLPAAVALAMVVARNRMG